MPPSPGKHVLPDRAEHFGRDRRRDAEQPWRRWYKTSRWQRLAEAVRLRDRYTCSMPGCGVVITGKGQAIADHRTPHRGDEALFWDAENIWCICKACHDSVKQAEERGGRMVRGDGWRP